MAYINDIRPSGLIKAFGWGTGVFVRGKDNNAIMISDAAMLIKKGNGASIQCFCLMGAIRVADELGAFTGDNHHRRVALLIELKEIAKGSGFSGGIESFNDCMTGDVILSELERAETKIGLTQPIPIPNPD